MTDMATPSKNPLSLREIRKMKSDKRKSEIEKLRIQNVTKLQTVNIQIYGKLSKLVPYQQSIQLAPGKSVDLPISRLMMEQITNLKRSGFIRTIKIDSKARIGEVPEASNLTSSLPSKVKPNKLIVKK